jgi:hypothetical protein
MSPTQPTRTPEDFLAALEADLQARGVPFTRADLTARRCRASPSTG